MAYIGKEPTVGNFQVCDAISVVNNQAAYTMQVGGVNVSPEEEIILLQHQQQQVLILYLI